MGMNYLYQVHCLQELLEMTAEERALAYLSIHSGHMPDALWDGNNLRIKRSRNKIEVNGMFNRLNDGGKGLQTITLPIDGGSLYSFETVQIGREIVENTVGSYPVYAKLERSRSAKMHVHCVTSKDLVVVGSYHQELNDVVGFAAYLAKPNDARASAHRHHKTGMWISPSQDDRYAALSDWIVARCLAKLSGQRLPRQSWSRRIHRKPISLEKMLQRTSP